MARIEHRRYLPEHGGPGSRQTAALARGWRRLDMPGRVFLLLAIVQLALGVWPVVREALAGAEWLASIPWRATGAISEAALVALPAAVALGRLPGGRRNELLRTGAIIVATLQLLRDPMGWLIVVVANGEQDATLLGGWAGALITGVLPLAFAIFYAAGVWALAEGLKDAGGRATRGVAALVLLATVGVQAVAWIPSLAQLASGDGLRPVDGANLLLSLLVEVPVALLIARVMQGALRGLDPRPAWRVGAAGLVLMVLVRVITSLQLMASQLRPPESTQIDLWFLGLVVPFGWPLFVAGVAMGMGRLWTAVAVPGARRVVIGGPPRFVPALD